MKRNFRFDDFSVIPHEGRLIDLHNAYDLDHFGSDLEGSEVIFRFTRNEYAIKPEELPRHVVLRCTGNVRIAFNNFNELAAPLRYEGVEIAYFDEDCEWRSFTDEQIATRQNPLGLYVGFINGSVVRIYCHETTFEALAG